MIKRKSESSARGSRVARNVKHMKEHTKKIDYSEIPELSDDQLKSMKRVGRPTIGENARQLIAIRIDPQVLMQLQKEAKKHGKGYQSLINEILAKHTKRSA
jgi:uncharacterized protein (DUF4415 family)